MGGGSNNLYGTGLTLGALMDIPCEHFAQQRGVGKTYVDRFKELQLYLGEQQSNQGECSERRREVSDSHIFNVPAKYRALHQLLKRLYPNLRSYSDVCHLSPSDFSSQLGVGINKVTSLIQWQSEIAANHSVYAIDSDLLDRLKGFKISSFYLNDVEQKLLTKFIRRGATYEELTPSFFIEKEVSDIVGQSGFGKKMAEALHTLQMKILDALKADGTDNILIPLHFGESRPLSQLSSYICEDLAKFNETLDGEESKIWSQRVGYNSELLTLQELGDSLGVTRERIRQRAAGMNAVLLRGIRVRPSLIREKLLNKDRSELLVELSELRNEFCTDTAMIKMLAVISESDHTGIIESLNPTVRRDVLDGFFCSHAYPVKSERVKVALQGELECSDDDAEIYLRAMVTAGLVREDESFLVPDNVRKETAVAHILAGCEGGLSWKEIASRVNDSGMCRTELSMERPDQVLNSSSFIYLSSAHLYSHMKFFPAQKGDVIRILDDIKSTLKSSSHDAIHLMSEYYSGLLIPRFDYYTIRHAVRNFGESKGLYFNGKSQSDSVSLSPDATRISQKEAVWRLFQSTAGPLTVQQMAKHIKSQTEDHARYYLGELLREGKIVSTEQNQYQSRKSAFVKINVASVSKAIRLILQEDTRIHHISSVARQLNRMEKSDYSNHYWRAFAGAYAEEKGWYAKGMLVSANEIPITGISTLVKEVSSYGQEDMVAWIQERVCASRDVIKRAIYNVRNELQQGGTAQAENGLAWDVMEELYSL
ncbi:sigma factor-like helix-turn-helix DNA-binding protein [Pontiellaceae bacterium B1224]|nr:sigma factor-like helix-turn-helix DNA-binding protein [Pontiellaceae bacterium B1224]